MTAALLIRKIDNRTCSRVAVPRVNPRGRKLLC